MVVLAVKAVLPSFLLSLFLLLLSIVEFLNSSTYYADLAWMNWEIAQGLWSLYADQYGEVIQVGQLAHVLGSALCMFLRTRNCLTFAYLRNSRSSVVFAQIRFFVQGWYTDVEESNVIGELQVMPDLVGHYLEPLARDLHENLTRSDNMTRPVWASPYYVYNLTRHPAESIMTTRFYADWWGQVFVEAPHLDFIAPQDSMGIFAYAVDSTFFVLH